MSLRSRCALFLMTFLLLSFNTGTISAQTNAADTEAAFDAAIDAILDAEPAAGPFGGGVDLVHGHLKNLTAGVQFAEFYAEAGFLTPANPPAGFWSVGICFWVDPQGNCYEAYIVSDGATAAWDVGYSEPSGAFESLATGEVVNLDLEPGATNYIGLYVSGSSGVITVNSYSPEGIFELPTTPLAGDIELRIGFSADNPAETGVVPMETFDFVVWDLAGMAATTAQTGDLDTTFAELKAAAQSQPSLAGPFQDAILQVAGSFNSYEAGVQLSDLYATVTFLNPDDLTVPWDIGFGIGYTGLDSEVRLIVESTGDWFAAIGPEVEFASGTGAVFNTGPNASNQLEVIAQGTTGYLAVNGAVVAQIDLPADRAVGDVFVASGFYGPNSVDQRLVPFQDFQVWALQNPAQPAAQSTAAPDTTLAPPETSQTFADLKTQAQAGPSAGGPYNDAMIQSSTALPFPSAGVAYTDLYATATFSNPDDTSQAWDIGIAIRYTGEDNEPRVILQSTGEWFVAFGSAEPMLSGQAPQFDAAPLGLNTIEIVAQEGVGYVAINGVVVTQLDLSQVVRPGDVFISTGFFSTNVVDGRALSYQAFDVWQLAATTGSASPSFTLSPSELLAGPYAGALIEREGPVDAAPAGVNTSDFFATITFVVPADASVPWEATLAFRDSGSDSQYRLTIVSTGEWWLSIGGQPPAATGAISNLNITPGQENRLDLVVEGTSGVAGLNGVDFATLDLSVLPGPGDLWVATGTHAANTFTGRITQYRAFEVWSLA